MTLANSDQHKAFNLMIYNHIEIESANEPDQDEQIEIKSPNLLQVITLIFSIFALIGLITWYIITKI